jgi:hypothetical protein
LNGKQASQYWKNDPKRAENLYQEAEFSCRQQLKRLGPYIKEDYFKITNLTAGKKKLVEISKD